MKYKKIFMNGIVILFISLLVIPVFAQDIKEYIKRDGKTIEDFTKLSQTERDKLWEDSKSGSSMAEDIRNFIAQELVEKITDDKIKNGELQGAIQRTALKTWTNRVLDAMKKQGITDIGGVDLSNMDFDDINKLSKKFLNVDLEKKLRAEIESVVGFGSEDLKWEDKNIIGNGKVWLDLDRLPPGVEKLEYNEKRGAFVLSLKGGGKVVLGEGATNSYGKLIFSSKLEGVGIRELLRVDLEESGLDNFYFLNGKGEVVLTKDGFEIKGGAKVKYGDFVFEGKSGESYVKFSNDRMIVKGVELEREGYVRVPATNEDFIVHYGRFDNLAKEISFEDSKMITLSSGMGTMGVPGGETIHALGKVYFKFDENGKLTHVGKKDVNDFKYVPITEDYKGNTDLAKIYESSGTTVRKIIEEGNFLREELGTSLDFEDIEKKFYADKYLTENAKEIKINSYTDNFLSMNGENFIVGGSGNIEVLRDLNSLTGQDWKNFKVDVGDFDIVFDEKGINYPRNPVKDAFEIKEISGITFGELKISLSGLTLTGDENGEMLVTQSGKLVAGRQTLLGPYGSSVDISMEFSKEVVEKIRENVEDTGWTEFTTDKLRETALANEFEIKIGINTNLEEVRVTGKGLKEGHDRFVADKFVEGLSNFALDTEDSKLGTRVLRDSTKDIIEGIKDTVISKLSNIDVLDLEKISVNVKYNPNENPSLMLNVGSKFVPIPLQGNEADFVRDMMELSLLVPDSGRGKIPYYSGRKIISFWRENVQGKDPLLEEVYGINSYLKRMWYINLGKGGDKWDRMVSELVSKKIEAYMGKYTIPSSKKSKDSPLRDTSRSHY